MEPFLYRIANQYYKHYQNTLHEFTFVFPNRRAGIFFQHHLSKIAENPVFSPQITTIDSCFMEASGLQTADRLNMLFQLYRIYKRISHSAESFDEFVYWGEIILADFNEVDKYRVDARQLFTNLKELKELSDYEDVFSEEQKQAIEQFWGNFYPTIKSNSQVEFLQTWEVLFPLYQEFKTELLKDNLGYEGMIARNVIDNLKNGDEIAWFDNKQFVFIGFNALNPCEKELMNILQKRNQADFYWDYEADALQNKDNPASQFFRANTEQFKSKFDISLEIQIPENKHIELYRIPSSIGQAKQIYQILDTLYPEKNQEKDYLKTAVVIPNEKLMLPIIYSIPEKIDKINVTMGYPLQITSIAGLMDHIFELHRRKKMIDGKMKFYHLTVRNVINQQFVAFICSENINFINSEIIAKNLIYIDESLFRQHKLLEKIFNPDIQIADFTAYLIDVIKALVEAWNSLEDKPEDHQLESSFLYQYYMTINRIDDLLKANTDIELQGLETLIRLIKQLTNSINIPFVGEPLNGLQIMGTLETRGLDFENIILSSFNEGDYPKQKTSNSFVPYHLRKGFALPTYEHQDAITAYNFYQIFNRAKKIYFISDSRAVKTNSGELSRFYYQLKYHYGYTIKETFVNYDVSIHADEAISIDKTTDIQAKLAQFVSNEDEYENIALSASSINTYIQCPLKFYLRNIEKINTPDEISESPEANVFGSILHDVMAKIYEPYANMQIGVDLITSISKNDILLDTLIQAAFAKHYFKIDSSKNLPTLKGNNLLISKVIKKYIRGVLNYDMKYAPYTFISGEKVHKTRLNTVYGDVKIKGYIDRIDSKDDVIRLLDYKTGRGELEFNNWDNLFAHHQTTKDQAGYVLQLLIYGMLYKSKAEGKTISPGLIYTQKIFQSLFNTEIIAKSIFEKKKAITDYAEVEEEFSIRLRSCIEEMFNPEVPFFQTDEVDACKYCDFKQVCKR